MKKFIVISLTICFSLVFALQSYGKENLEITLEKAGQLKKHIKKDDIKYVKSLILTGPVNNNDLELVAALENLEYLNLEKTDLDKDKYDSEKRSFYDGRTLRISEFPYLKKFVGPKQYCDISGLSKLPNLKTVYLLSGWGFGRYNDIAKDGFINTLDTLAILSKGGRTSETEPNKFIASIAEHYFEPEYLLRPIKTKFLYIDTPERFKEIIPNILITPSNTILYHWSSDLTEEDLMNIDYLAPYSYSDFNLAELTIPLRVKTLSSNLFGKYDSSKPKKIQNIDLKNVEDIERHALNGCEMDLIILPPSLKYFHQDAFENNHIKSARFTSSAPPVVYEKKYNSGKYQTVSYLHHNTFTKFIVPKGNMEKFKIGPWAKANLMEEGVAQEYKFDIKEPGTLSNYITDENALAIDDLTITGILYDTDFEIIKKCKNLRRLDLAKTFCCLSPQTIEQNKQTEKAFLELFGLMLEGAAQDSNVKFTKGNGSFIEAAYYNTLNEKYKQLMAQPSSSSVPVDPMCKLPVKAFDGLKYLERIVYPEALSTLSNGGLDSKAVIEVILPPNLDEINAHIGSPRLESINIPSTVKKIAAYTFSGSESLKEVDLRNTNVETISNSAFYNCPNLINFYASPVLKEFSYDNNDWSKLQNGWFYTTEKPNGLGGRVNFRVIHIPAGCTAGYPSIHNTQIIDDITDYQ